MKFISFARRLVPVLVAVTGIVAFGTASAETTLERVNRTGTVRIGYSNESPFAYTQPDGKVTGESPEITRIIFAKLGANKVDAVLTEWGALIPGLKAGRFDLIAAGMYVTPVRLKEVLFTDPHYQIGDTLLVAKGNPKKLQSYADVAKDSSIKIAIMSGTAEYNYAKKAGILDSQILQVPDTVAQLQSVLTGRADAAIGTQLTMKGLAKKSEGRVGVAESFTDDPANIGYGGLAFRKEDKDLRDAVNKELHAWLGSAEHLKTIEPFGFDKSNLTEKTVADIEAGI